MRSKMKRPSPDVALTRILEALGQELIDAPDEEIIGAAKDLRMDLTMKESAAFSGLKYPAMPQWADFFEPQARGNLQGPEKPLTAPGEPKRKPRRFDPTGK
jgi:hypothetical protein